MNWLTVHMAHNLYLLGKTTGPILADYHHCHESVKIGRDNRNPICLRLRQYVSQNEIYDYIVGI